MRNSLESGSDNIATLSHTLLLINMLNYIRTSYMQLGNLNFASAGDGEWRSLHFQAGPGLQVCIGRRPRPASELLVTRPDFTLGSYRRDSLVIRTERLSELGGRGKRGRLELSLASATQ